MSMVKQTNIYIGLNDSDTHEQKYDTKRYVDLLKNVCYSYHVAFSMSKVDGGYFHEDGSYVEEQSLVLTLLDVADETAEEIARDLCAFFHQESVMVTTAMTDVRFIQETIDPEV